MNNDLPLVSVVVPCYNHEKYISECIRSIMNQTYRNFELIVIDDGSIDNSFKELMKLKAEYNFTLVSQENRGLPATFNRGLKEFVKGEYFTFCASDDFWCLDKLENQVNFMLAHPEIPMCYGKTHYVNENSEVIEKYDKQNNYLRGGELFEDIFLFKIHPPVNYLIKTKIFDEIGYYDENIFAEDYYMNLKIAHTHAIGFVDQYLGFYRVDSSIGKVIRFDKVSDSHLMSIEDYKTHPLYNKAKLLVSLRKFNLFSGYKEHKKIALKNSIKSISLFYKKQFIISLAKLLFLWR